MAPITAPAFLRWYHIHNTHTHTHITHTQTHTPHTHTDTHTHTTHKDTHYTHKDTHYTHTHMLSCLPALHLLSWECISHTHSHTHTLFSDCVSFAGQVPKDQGKSTEPALSDSEAVLYTKEPPLHLPTGSRFLTPCHVPPHAMSQPVPTAAAGASVSEGLHNHLHLCGRLVIYPFALSSAITSSRKPSLTSLSNSVARPGTCYHRTGHHIEGTCRFL